MAAKDSEGAAVLDALFAVIEARRGADPDQSYVAKTLAGGTPAAARKFGEEALETVIAALRRDRDEVVRESADLLFHLLVLWADAGITPDEVYAELARRRGTSGLAEKAARAESNDT
ncbi:MAG: phosphoribosyl-ATP diphosphatase [Alphaproteobacteria bacterium]